MYMEFEWDLNKENTNVEKHGVSFAEAVECFSDPKGFNLDDTSHSSKESRFYWLGKSKSGRVLTTRFTMRGNKIRIFGSAEWRKFRNFYNETTKTKQS